MNHITKISVTILLAIAIPLSIASCGRKDRNETDPSKDNTNQQENTVTQDPLEILTTVWNSYPEDEKFAVAGGDMSEENSVMDAPGKFSVEDNEALDATLGFPVADTEKIEDAASLVHLMNANTFTCGAFRVKNTDDLSNLTASLKNNIMQRQWMCGFPEKLIIAIVDDNVISCFGNGEIVEQFKSKLSAAYSQTEIVCDEAIV